MRMLQTEKTDTLKSWLSQVNGQLQVRRVETQGVSRPKRNRDRERARREARALFSEFYAEMAIDLAHTH
jgi:hypothetical protein